jgi:hypothetical protein
MIKEWGEMKHLTGLAAVVALLAGLAPAWGWTLVYDGFPYEPTSATVYIWDSGAYQIGRDPTQGNYNYTVAAKNPADAWVTTIVPPVITQGYFPFIVNDSFTVTGLPAATGHGVQLFSSSSTNGKGSRLAPGGPRAGRFGFGPGTLYYSLVLKTIDSAAVTTPGGGGFIAGFNNSPPGTDGLSLGVTKLYLRRTATAGQFQIGLGDGGTTIIWHPVTFPAGTTSAPVLIVGGYEFKNNWGDTPNTTDDVHSLWINPDSSTFGSSSPPPPTLTMTGADQGGYPSLTVQSFFVRQPYVSSGGPPAKCVVDEVRIGATWAGVTGDVACVPPTITDATPTAGDAGTTVTGVTITGTHFVRGATAVRLSMTGQADIWANNVDVTSDTALTCDFTIPAGAVAGLRNIVLVTCPDSPQTLAGKKFAISCIDSTVPTVTGMSPAVGYAGATITSVGVTGTGFVAGATGVRLTMAGQPDITATNVVVNDPTSLTCTLALPAAAAAGPRTLVVTNFCAASPGEMPAAFNLKRCGDPRYDDDGDGDVDMADFAVFQRCVTLGQGGVLDAVQCRCMNANGDTLIDTNDLAAFTSCASGPGVPASAACDDALSPL